MTCLEDQTISLVGLLVDMSFFTSECASDAVSAANLTAEEHLRTARNLKSSLRLAVDLHIVLLGIPLRHK